MTYRLLILVTVCLAACSKSKIPKGIMEPEKMQAVYWDYIRADIYANEFLRKDSSKNIQLESAKLQLQVFKLHKTTREEFYRSYDYYKTNTPLFRKMLDSMIVQAERKKNLNTDPPKKAD